MIETDVLIVGSGPSGATAALALSTYGIPNIVVTKYRWLADTPRAHVTNSRTFEVLRDLGVEEEANALAVPYSSAGNAVFCVSLAGEELARIHAFGDHPERRADYTLSSPCAMADLPQNLLEPVLVANAASRGTRLRFDTEYLSLIQDQDGVTATLLDRLSGETYQIRAKYLIGADGGRSKIVEQIGLPMEGRMGLSGSMNVVFEADLSTYVAHRPALLYLVVQPGLGESGIGIGVIRTVRQWNQWLLITGYDVNGPAPQLSTAKAVDIVRTLVGDPELPVKISSTSLWTVNHMVATRYSAGRVFCMGDAVHRHPPTNGLGSNTSIQDAYNLAWKLALVLQGKADAELLESYNDERVPVGKQVVGRANESVKSYGPIFDALGLLGAESPSRGYANMDGRKASTPEAAVQRERLRQAIAEKTYEYNAHGVEMNHRYDSSAVVSDGREAPASNLDEQLYYLPTTLPGARIPHTWLQRGKENVSTLDLVGKGRFSILTGIGGEAWIAAAATIAERFDLSLASYTIGPDRDLTDLYGEWAALREINEAGCLLVRPDGHIAWRAWDAARDDDHAVQCLTEAFAQVLHVSAPRPSLVQEDEALSFVSGGR